MIRHRFASWLLASVAASALLLSGCGAAAGVPTKTSIERATFNGKPLVKLGFGAEGGESPAVIRRADGTTVVVYAGTNVRDRRLYWAAGSEATMGAAKPVSEHPFSDQSPSLVEDAAGALHLFFASNTDGRNFELFHSQLVDGAWAQPTVIPGYTGIQNLAVTYRDGRFLLAAEVTGEGLVAATSADGDAWIGREVIAKMGFEPGATFLPDGTALVVYQHHGDVFYKSSAPGADWGPETLLADAADRIKTPTVTWSGDHGLVVYAARGADMSYSLAGKRFDRDLKFTDLSGLPSGLGEAKTPALSGDHNGRTSLAWGMKLTSGSQGIALTVIGE